MARAPDPSPAPALPPETPSLVLSAAPRRTERRGLGVPGRLSRTRRLDLLCVLLLAGVAFLYLWRVTIQGDLLLPLDLVYSIEPWRSEAANKPAGPPWNPILSDTIWQFYPSLDYAYEA
jgi:hypothetical protein